MTLSPYMGFDSIEPYLRYPGKGVFLLCRTSNAGGADLQAQRLADGELVYERIARLAGGAWNRNGQLGLVVGATYPAEIARVRELAPTLPLLTPGLGAPGGDAEAGNPCVCRRASCSETRPARLLGWWRPLSAWNASPRCPRCPRPHFPRRAIRPRTRYARPGRSPGRAYGCLHQ